MVLVSTDAECEKFHNVHVLGLLITISFLNVIIIAVNYIILQHTRVKSQMSFQSWMSLLIKYWKMKMLFKFFVLHDVAYNF